MNSQFFPTYFIVLLLGLQQHLLAQPEKLAPIRNLTGCQPPDTSIRRNSIQNILKTKYGDGLCGCGGPGWRKIVDLDMSDTSQTCPTSNWRLINSNLVRSCGRTASGCQSAVLPSGGVSYSQVCGRILALQFGHPDGLAEVLANGIDGVYVDGVSLTHGNSPRQHVWTFVGIASDDLTYLHSHCPCSNVNGNVPSSSIPPWIGSNYFCDTANTGSDIPTVYYPNNPLWDGQGCSSVNQCCMQNSPPWFCASLPNPTSDDLEVRICGNEGIAYEDTVITRMEVYVK